jgi:hypothetical protein
MTGAVAGFGPSAPLDDVKRMNEDTIWRERAERVVGPLEPYTSRTLSASEIGEFGFCPQAWFLGRCNIPLDEEAQLRLEAGTRAHQRIGRQTDLLRASERVKTGLLISIAVLAVLAVIVATRGGL